MATSRASLAIDFNLVNSTVPLFKSELVEPITMLNTILYLMTLVFYPDQNFNLFKDKMMEMLFFVKPLVHCDGNVVLCKTSSALWLESLRRGWQNCFISTLEKNPYVCRIEFFPPKINVIFQLNCICHKLLTCLTHIEL